MADLEKIASLSAASVGRALAAGEACPVELAEHLLARCEANVAPHAFIRLTRERALQQAEAAKARITAGRPASALDGVPIALKDLIDLEGEITTAASELRRNAAPAMADAPCAAALDRAGLVFLGKTNLTEFAFSGLGLNPHYGTPANPHDPTTPRVPGGSSSGSAVAVAAGLAPCSIGTDTGGSVRVPASLNGLTGYKSSEGRINKSGVFALSRTLDTVGPLARSVEDCILLDMAMRDVAVSAIRRAEPAALRCLVPETFVLDDLDPAVAANFTRSLDRLAEAGVQIERAPCPIFTKIGEITARYGTLASAEAYADYACILESDDVNKVDARVVARMRPGGKMSAVDLLRVQQARADLQAAFAEYADGRLTLMPTTAHTAPEIAPLEADPDLFHRINLKTLRNTLMGNFLNLPGVALPNGTDALGLPTSLLVSGLADQDERVLGAALAVESILAE